MKFRFTLLGVLCAHVLAQDENMRVLKATVTSADGFWNDRREDLNSKRDSTFGPTPKGEFVLDATAVVVKKTPPSLSNGASIKTNCSTAVDEINVGVQGIVAKNGVEYLYLPMVPMLQAACFESYNNTILEASDLVSCCDAAAAGGYNSFRYDEGGCKGFAAWLSPLYTRCTGQGLVSPGLFVAKQKLSKFTPNAPTFTTSSSLALAKIIVFITNIVDACPYSKTLKVTTFSKTHTMKLDFLTTEGQFYDSLYLPELCNDSASTDKRTVTVSILDSDGSELASVKEVVSSGLAGRHLLSNGVCVLHSGSPLRNFVDADTFCANAASYLPFGDGFLPFPDLLQKLAGFEVLVMDFWTGAQGSGPYWTWDFNYHEINTSLFNVQSFENNFSETRLMANVTDKLLYLADATTVHHTVCIDAPYIGYFD